MIRAGRKPEGKPYTTHTILGFLTSWKTLLFTLIFTMQPFGSQPFQSFVFWLKAHNKKGQPMVYTIAQIVSSHPHSRNHHLPKALLTLCHRTNTQPLVTHSQPCTR